MNASPRVAQLRSLGEQLNARAPVQRAASDGLPPKLQAGLEQMSGLSMADVTVHRNSSKPAQLRAHAYTQGSNIYLGPGQEQHMAHEAWHVVQQKQGRVAPTIEEQGQAINDDPALEQEADRMGARASTTSSDY